MKKTLIFALCMGVASFVGCDDEGDFCVFDNDCKSGLCVNNMCIGVIKPVGYGCDSDGDSRVVCVTMAPAVRRISITVSFVA